MTTVALVESPAQAMSLREAVAVDVVPDRVATVVRSDVRADDAALADLGPVHVLDAAGFAHLMRCDHLVVGDAFSGLAQAVIVAARPKRVTIVDDGASTLHLVDRWMEPSGLARASSEPPWWRRVLIRRAAARLAVSEPTIVTGLPLSGAVIPGADVIVHSFPWARSVSSRTDPRLSTGRHGVVVGSALYVDGHIEPRRYFERVAHWATLGGFQWYVPHRREPDSALAAVPQPLEVLRPDAPIELALRDVDELALATWPSTPAMTVARVRDGSTDVRVAAVPDSWWTSAAPGDLRKLAARIVDLVTASGAIIDG